MESINLQNKASLACQVRMSIRCKEELPYKKFVIVIKNPTERNIDEYQNYLYGFFEECYPSLIKKFMIEQDISREEILHVFDILPERGEKRIFQEVLQNGQF